MSDQEMCHQLTLDSGRVVVLRELQVRHHKKAAEAAAHKSKNNSNLLALYMQDEILKLLVIAVDGNELSAVDRERIDTFFTHTEYRQVMMIIEEMVGEANRPKVEIVSYSGGKSLGSAATPA